MMDFYDDTLDELVSAYLDGEATPDERVRVEADPALLSRVALFAGVRGELGADVTLAAEDSRESSIAAALGVFDAEVANAASAAGGLVDDAGPRVDDAEPRVAAATLAATTPIPAAPTSIATAREQRARRWRPLLAVAGAAAIGVAAMSALSNRSANDDQITTAGDAPVETIASIEGGADAAASVQQDALADTGAAEVAPSLPSETSAAAAAPAVVSTDRAFTTEAPAVALTTEEQLQSYAADLSSRLEAKVAGPSTTAATESGGAATGDSAEPSAATSLEGPCPEVAGVFVTTVTWQGADGMLLLAPDVIDATNATIVSVDCVVLVSVALG
jgi:hypothetical protein